MEITEQTVLRVAELAHLALSDDELTHYQKQLGRVIEFVNQLKAVELPPADADPSPGFYEREDICRPSLTESEVTLNAPKRTGSSFTVPRIIESK